MDFYETLGVSPRATPSEISTAYRKLATKYHPDKNPNNADAVVKFKEATAAFETLHDDGKRARYNATLPKSRLTGQKQKTAREMFEEAGLVPGAKNMTPEERKKEWIRKNDPNMGFSNIRSAAPPKFDIWGKPLSEEGQQAWARENGSKMIPPKPKPKPQPKPQNKPKPKYDPNRNVVDGYFYDAFADKYDGGGQPDLR